LNGTMLSVSDKYDSVNEHTQEIKELIKLHIQGRWQNSHKFFRQLTYAWHTFMTSQSYLQLNCVLSEHKPCELPAVLTLNVKDQSIIRRPFYMTYRIEVAHYHVKLHQSLSGRFQVIHNFLVQIIQKLNFEVKSTQILSPPGFTTTHDHSTLHQSTIRSTASQYLHRQIDRHTDRRC